MINYENLRMFAYSNDRLLIGEPKGLVISFFGLGGQDMFENDIPEGIFYASANIVFVIPYLNPWAWMNDDAIKYSDAVIDSIEEHYNIERISVCSSGGSMGGQSALVFSRYSKNRIVSCVANCPVTDMVFHITERKDLPRTMLSAFGNSADFDSELKRHSPYHLIDEMPKIKYTVFHCENDLAVNKKIHSDKFVKGMRTRGYTIDYYSVPERGHCDLTPEIWEKYRETCKKTFL